ncbi:Tripeptidyl-peptidase sed2 [Emydomyces testavorans]|uniref:tripeptidyl-peptidase II n=1 Tax=Emydomyces testavorans TaxID=2070801 RepID=A0AAF0DFJ5_9EURO|nr:Tripeptidyl-peptidase sed2 [Emydomyces testavorans]
MASFMMRLYLLFLFLTAATAATRRQQLLRGGNWALLERVVLPAGWTQGPSADPNAIIYVKINLRDVFNVEQLHQRTVEIGTPGHPRYGLHLKREEINDLMKPNETVTRDVRKWLIDGGVKRENIKFRADWVDVALPIKVASQLLNTHFYEFQDRHTKAKVLRTTEYWAPTSVAQYIYYIYPLVLFTRTAAQSSNLLSLYTEEFPLQGKVSAACPEGNTPSCLRGLYNLGNVTAKPGNRNKIAVSGYLDQYAQYKDLSLFLRRYVPQAIASNFSVSLVNGGQNTQNSTRNSMEANLDIQYTIGLSYNIKVNYISVKGRGPLHPDLDQPDPTSSQNEPYMDQLRYLLDLSDDELPTVLTTSYGESEQSVPESYARATCNEFAKLTARGVSVIFSSGDIGVGSCCLSNDGKNKTVFNPIFPATCPFVKSVGSTHSRNPEQAVGFSSGGFSDYFKRPDWQVDAVSKYLFTLNTTWEGYYNPLGRGFPDVAAQGVEYPIYEKGQIEMVSGTSASAPTIAVIIAHLNEVRLAQGKPVLGFLNPWLYGKGFRGFRDITHGGSTGCTGKSIYSGLPTRSVPYASWNATKGWDPVTGFGTPDFHKLIELLP